MLTIARNHTLLVSGNIQVSGQSAKFYKLVFKLN